MTTRLSRRIMSLATFAAIVFISLAGAAGTAAAQGKPTAQKTPIAGPEASGLSGTTRYCREAEILAFAGKNACDAT